MGSFVCVDALFTLSRNVHPPFQLQYKVEFKRVNRTEQRWKKTFFVAFVLRTINHLFYCKLKCRNINSCTIESMLISKVFYNVIFKQFHFVPPKSLMNYANQSKALYKCFAHFLPALCIITALFCLLNSTSTMFVLSICTKTQSLYFLWKKCQFKNKYQD